MASASEIAVAKLADAKLGRPLRTFRETAPPKLGEKSAVEERPCFVPIWSSEHQDASSVSLRLSDQQLRKRCLARDRWRESFSCSSHSPGLP
ncbi:unnamed protein product [Vitrella brassicaformis CCMP3155]|uniref:Uncharacterized protein n=1 Tax=Vitrella brassicaformis (strain CCMP3155) TaxID=1169540 RepID=A0A0G4FTD7_VITBC|nr:unnamed protein product [Vitrella brassicaformis CCMP3155]|eukprot:CEM17934.1 unnamed protein product [Vitrella brassicaformis CCMP3155]